MGEFKKRRNLKSKMIMDEKLSTLEEQPDWL